MPALCDGFPAYMRFCGAIVWAVSRLRTAMPVVPVPPDQLRPGQLGAVMLGGDHGMLLAALDPEVIALDLAGVPYWQARRVGVHRIGQLTKPDLLVV